MKTNQDGGSVTASDPAAAGKQLAADQAGAAKTYGGNKGDESAKTKAKVKAVKKDAPKDYEGGARMGYSQKFGPGRMNGYDAAAKKTMDVMSHGGASRYMAEGPAQGANQEIVATGQQDQYKREFRAKRKNKFDAMNERLRINKDEARTDQAITKQHDINSM